MAHPLIRSDLICKPELRGRAFAEAWSARVDAWLVALFVNAVERTGTGGGVALVALGGQGRRELAPQSDLDLLLLYDSRRPPGELAEALWHPIWDEGLKLGHAVRNVRDTLSLASSDLETATSLLSARHLCGDEALSTEVAERARINWRRRGRAWLSALWDSIEHRHRGTGEVANALEPDLKDGRGGLRDVHALGWATAAGARVDRRLLAGGLTDAHEALFDVRVALHRVAGRPGDTLVLEHQDAVAEAVDEVNADALMARVTAAGRIIANCADEAWWDITSTGASTALRPRARDRRLGETRDELRLRENRVALSDEMRPPRDPFAVLDVAIAAAREHKRISLATLNALVGAPKPPDLWPRHARRRFVELLLTGHGAVAVIETLVVRGLWTRLLPEWHQVRCLPQRNAFHRFTVDRHLLECAAEAAGSAHLVERPDLLVVAALLHDIGKAVRGSEDHSIEGAPMAAGMAQRMGFPDDDVATITALVEHHLLLADVATRRDLEDPASARFVAQRLGSPERVMLLHALTRADAVATGPATWSPWRAEMVDLLAHRTCELLTAIPGSVGPVRAFPDPGQLEMLHGEGVEIECRGDRLTVAFEDRPGAFVRIAGVLALHGLDVVAADIHSDRARCVDEFRVRLGRSETVAWDRVADDVARALDGRLALRSRLVERERSMPARRQPGQHQFDPAVRFDNEAASGSTVIEVVGPDSVGLLYRLARALGEFDLAITGARIHTMGVDAVDSFYVTTRDGERLTSAELQAEITRALLEELEPPGAK